MMTDLSNRAGRRVLALVVLACAGCGTPPEGEVLPTSLPGLFRDVTVETGVDFVHFTGGTGDFRFPEIMGSGTALFDFDGDGDLDLYLVQGAAWDVAGESPTGRPGNRLLRNDLVRGADGTGSDNALAPTFVDVTPRSGAGHEGYGMGVAVGDYDGDNDLDLYVTNFGPNALYRNNGDGTFTDVSDEAAVASPEWSTSASFLDYDGDGDLDLFHANYVAFAEDVGRVCRRPAGDQDYCTPLAYRPQPDVLYRNEGDGMFRDVTGPAGLGGAFGNGLGTIASDFNGDSRPDIYVANDGVANQLWLNRGDGSFEEGALLSGVAFNRRGEAEAGMGVAVADIDGDGDLDLFLTHLYLETNTLYVNQGNGVFDDATLASGLGVASRSMTGFGTHFLDYDADGLLDVLVVNGAVTKVDVQIGDDYPYMMPNQLFHATAPGRFEDVSESAGEALRRLESSRGAALGDLELDGDLDVVISNNRGRAQVLRNEAAAANRWLSVASGSAKPVLELTAGRLGTQSRTPRTDGSYCSARDPRVFFGLGSGFDPGSHSATLSARWVSGPATRWHGLPANRHFTIQGRSKR